MASQPIGIEETDKERTEREKLESALAGVIQELETLSAEAVQKRAPTEERWMENLRQFHGIYTEKVRRELDDSENARSKIFINITRPKTNAWAARLGDMLFPNDEKNWGIDPTPVPSLTRQAKELAAEAEQLEAKAAEAVEQNNAAIDAGGAAPPELGAKAEQAATLAKAAREREEQFQREMGTAKRAASLMEREIDDQLTESRYPARCRDIIDDMCKVGTGILKGPIVRDKGRRKWALTSEASSDSAAVYSLANDNHPTPSFRRVNYWHFFPDPSAETIEDAEYTFERHLPNKKMLRKMAKDLGFNKHAVRKLLKSGPQGEGAATGSTSLSFMAELRSLENGGTGGDLQPLNDRYVVWEFYGSLEIEQVETMIRAMGREEDADEYAKSADPLEPIMVRVFFCDGQLLKIEEDFVLDSGECLYSVGTFEKSESSILGGVGIPHLMSDEQSMLNAGVRMMMDNGALAVGPQIVVDKEIIQPENGSWKLTPRKIWQRIKAVGRPDTKGERPFETYDIPFNQAMLAAIVDMALKFIDEAVAMPLIAQGDQGEYHTQTKGGMSMLFNQANVVFRRVVKNWDDDITEPTIRRAYDFNMQFSDKDEIKGDMKAEARGTSVLLVREMQAEQLLAILRDYSLHPLIGPGLKAYNCMKLVLQAMSINPSDVLIDEEEYTAKLEQMSQGDQQPSSDEIRAQSQIEVANIDAQSRREQAESNERVAQLRADTEMARLASQHELSLEQIRAMFKGKELDANVKLGTKKMETDSRERSQAAEMALERENADRAEARGLEPTGSGGFISMGAEKP